MDEEGFEDGTFNIHFRKLSPAEMKRNLDIAKAIPFAKTNEELKEYDFPNDKPGTITEMLSCLKNFEDTLCHFHKKEWRIYVRYAIMILG